MNEDMSLQVLDSEDGAVIASYCGTGIPDPLTSSGSILYIRLVSTSDAIGNRFSASWTTGTVLIVKSTHSHNQVFYLYTQHTLDVEYFHNQGSC